MLTSAARRGPWRRERLSLPYGDQVPELAQLLDGKPGRHPPHLSAEPGRLVDAALHHRVAAYLVRALRNGSLELPEFDRVRVESATAGSIMHAAVLRHELANVVAVVGGACDAAPLVVKGPALAEIFYPDRRLRPYFDLDLIVPRDHLGDAVRALEEDGYERLEEFREGYAERYGHDVHLRRTVANRVVDVELHWRIGDDPVGLGLSHERLVGDAELVQIDGAAIDVPGAPAHLLVLAVHLLSDREKRLCWINDLRLVAASLDDEAWSRAFTLAAELELGWPLYRALDYAEHHLGFERARPGLAAPAPAWGPLRAVEELSLRASPHVGRLAVLGWRERLAFLRAVLVPTRAGLVGTVGQDGAATWRLVGRHARQALAGLAPRRDRR
jgi:hypothetical protein